MSKISELAISQLQIFHYLGKQSKRTGNTDPDNPKISICVVMHTIWQKTLQQTYSSNFVFFGILILEVCIP